MTRTLSTLDVLNICTWYKQTRENPEKPLNALPLKAQWILKKNISVLTPTAENFISLQQESEDKLRQEYGGDDKSYIDTDENGQEVRKVKDQCLEEFQQEVNSLNKKLNDILEEKTDFELSNLDIESLLDEIGTKETALTVDDLEILSLMTEE